MDGEDQDQKRISDSYVDEEEDSDEDSSHEG